ncbi:MAG: class I SAM-dependent methyltransferase [Pseudomonadota bacterium]
MKFLTDNQYIKNSFNTVRNMKGRKRYGKFQIDFLDRHGLDAATHVLDFGCADLRLGELILPKLETGRYYGVDINAEALERGRQHCEAEGISTERATLFATDRFALDPIPDGTLDIAFSNSVFSHLTLNSILLCLRAVLPKLKPGGTYYSSMIILDEEWPVEQPKSWNQQDSIISYPARDPYHYPFSLVQQTCAWAGASCELRQDYGHPFQKMVAFTRAA